MRAWNIGMLLLLLVLGYLWLAGDGGVRQERKQDEELRRLSAQNLSLAERNRRLEASLEDLRSGTDEIEEQARQRLGMIRQDEQFYQLVDPPAASAPEKF